MNVPQVNRLADSLYTGNPDDVRTVVREYARRGLIRPCDVDRLGEADVRRVALNAVNDHHLEGLR